jgi:hypothetical protein
MLYYPYNILLISYLHKRGYKRYKWDLRKYISFYLKELSLYT